MFSLDQSLGFVVNRTATCMRSQLMADFEAHGFDITSDQWLVLNRLNEEDGISQKELAIRVYKDKTNTARIIEIMERKGLIERRTDAEDQRQRLVYLTAQGSSTYQHLIPIVRAALQRAQEGFSDEEISQLISTLNRIYYNLT